ncbi:MAG: RcnB family protein [Pseudomonadota bacterium]
MTYRWMIGLLAAATALTPIAASAQNGGFGDRIAREARGEHRGGEHRGNREGRVRQEQRAPDAQPQPQPQYQPRSNPQPQSQPRYERQGRTNPDGNVNRGPRPDRGNGDGGVRWNPRGDDSNAARHRVEQRPNPRYEQRTPSTPVGQGRWQGRRNDGGGLGSDIVRDARRGGADGSRYDRDGHYERHDNRGDNSRYDRSRGYGNGRGYDGNQRYDRHDRNDNGRRWDRSWRSDRRYDWYDHRSRYRDQYSWGRYYSPYRNWDYRRISIGFSLWPLFYSDQYWINDPWQYRLPDAYGPYRWVRYYDDALLVDVRSGEVVDVIDNFFW